MNMQLKLKAKTEIDRDTEVFKNYEAIRDRVLQMIEDMIQEGASPSQYWAEEVVGFQYLFDASPLIINLFREHCYHITGIYSYPYRQHHGKKNTGHSRRFKDLQAIDKRGLFVPESPALGGFGYDVGPGLANIDTLKFYEVMIGLNKAGLLDTISDGGTVVEIGAGWGGFAYQTLTLFPKTKYVIIDLPNTMLFSSVYLRTVFPEARILFHGEDNFASRLTEGDFDIAFVPHYAAERYTYPSLKFGVNMASFQEMTAEQVSGYAKLLSSNNCNAVYSLNRKRSPYNTQLQDVEAELGKYYTCQPIHVLNSAYTTIGKKKRNKVASRLNGVMKRFKGTVKRLRPGREDLGYKHVVGRLS